jgi:peptide chain release factor subunit 1
MISLILPVFLLINKPNEQVSREAKILAEEYEASSNIKSKVNRLSVLGIYYFCTQKLAFFNKVPPNGLAIYWYSIFKLVELS